MNTEIYIISYVGYDEYGPIIVQGPAGLDIREYCAPLLKDAARKAVEAAKRDEKELGYQGGVQASDVQEELVRILVDQGFIVLKPKELFIDDRWFWAKSKFDDTPLSEYSPLKELYKHCGEYAYQIHELNSLEDDIFDEPTRDIEISILAKLKEE